MVDQTNSTSKIFHPDSITPQPSKSEPISQKVIKHPRSNYLQSVNKSALESELSSAKPLIEPVPNASHQRFPFVQKFLDQSIGRKELLALLICELLPVLSLGIGSIIILNNSFRAQLQNQAKSEVAITETNYNAKINQMGLGGREQSDNPTLVNASRAQLEGGVGYELQTQVKQLLKNEVKIRKLDYATLVGKDLRIIANANASRQGEIFNPDGLVGEAIKTAHQIKASVIVPWNELSKEAPPLPPGLNNQQALVRYVITPIKDPNTQEVIGTLVFGDVVNGKSPIVEDSLNSLNGGYSAVYMRQPNGDFALATAIERGNSANSSLGRNLPLPDVSLLKTATTTQKGEASTDHMAINGNSYTIAAKAIPNKVVETGDSAFSAYSSRPTAILVRGTPEDSLHSLLRISLLQEGAVLFVGLLMILFWSSVFRKVVIRPIKNLEQTVQAFASGYREARAEIFFRDEIGQLATIFNYMADEMVASEQALTYMADEMIASEQALKLEAKRQQYQAQEFRLLNDIVANLRRSLKAEDILRTSVNETRDMLDVERVLIYRFSDDFKSGVIIAEAVVPGWTKALGQVVHDPMVEGAIERFSSGKVAFITNLDEANLSHCHCEILKRLEVKANIIAPIKYNNQLLGLLCVHQCSKPRDWQPSEIDLMGQLAAQIGYALDQAYLLERQEEASKQAKQLYEITLHMQESLDRQAIFNGVVRDIRKSLDTDRAIVYLFDEKWQGTIVAESVGQEWPSSFGSTIADPCFAEKYAEKYRQGRIQATPDIYEAGLTSCHLEQLAPFQVKANLVAPILANNELLGLLIVHQCSNPRAWNDTEIGFFRQVAIQLGLTIDRVSLFEQREQARLQAEEMSEEQRQQKEALQYHLLTLLGNVEGAAMGDLTVRADVTAGDMGIVADFFNSIIESLRQIVTKVKQSALQVNAALGENEGAIRELAQEALKQARETTLTLDSVEQMTHSIRAVAESARQAAEVTHTASRTAEAGENAMDLTVRNILALRDTIGETTKKVKRLGESSQQISKVVSLINQIALQTNLLAIN
ncbi:MAG: GAF domain-containing protein, partial [Kovacikia sp.]